MLNLGGMSITVTSAANVGAFLFGSMTAIPAIKWFCYTAVLCVICDWVLQLTFFLAAFALVEKHMPPPWLADPTTRLPPAYKGLLRPAFWRRKAHSAQHTADLTETRSMKSMEPLDGAAGTPPTLQSVPEDRTMPMDQTVAVTALTLTAAPASGDYVPGSDVAGASAGASAAGSGEASDETEAHAGVHSFPINSRSMRWSGDEFVVTAPRRAMAQGSEKAQPLGEGKQPAPQPAEASDAHSSGVPSASGELRSTGASTNAADSALVNHDSVSLPCMPSAVAPAGAAPNDTLALTQSIALQPAAVSLPNLNADSEHANHVLDGHSTMTKLKVHSALLLSCGLRCIHCCHYCFYLDWLTTGCHQNSDQNISLGMCYCSRHSFGMCHCFACAKRASLLGAQTQHWHLCRSIPR